MGLHVILMVELCLAGVCVGQRLFNYTTAELFNFNTNVGWKKIAPYVASENMIGVLTNNSIANFSRVTGGIEGSVIISPSSQVDSIIPYDRATFAIKTPRCVYFLSFFSNQRPRLFEFIGPCDDRDHFPGVVEEIMAFNTRMFDRKYLLKGNIFSPKKRVEGFQTTIGTRFQGHMLLKIEIIFSTIDSGLANLVISNLNVSHCIPECKQLYKSVDFTVAYDGDKKIILTTTRPTPAFSIEIFWGGINVYMTTIAMYAIDGRFKINSAMIDEWGKRGKFHMDPWTGFILDNPLFPTISAFATDSTEYCCFIAVQSEHLYSHIIGIINKEIKSWSLDLLGGLAESIDEFSTSVNKMLGVLDMKVVDHELYVITYPSLICKISVTDMKKVPDGRIIRCNLLSAKYYENDLLVFPLKDEALYSTAIMDDGFILFIVYVESCYNLLMFDSKLGQFDYVIMNNSLSRPYCLPSKTASILSADSKAVYLSLGLLTQMTISTVPRQRPRNGVYKLVLKAETPPPVNITFDEVTQLLSWKQEPYPPSDQIGSYCIYCVPLCPRAISTRKTEIRLAETGLKFSIQYTISVTSRAESGLYSRRSLPKTVVLVNLPQPEGITYDRNEYMLSWRQVLHYEDLDHFELVCEPKCFSPNSFQPIKLPYDEDMWKKKKGLLSYILVQYGFAEFNKTYSVAVVPATSKGRKGILSEAININLKFLTIITKASIRIIDRVNVQLTYSIVHGEGYTYPRFYSLRFHEADAINYNPLPPFLAGDEMSLIISFPTTLHPEESLEQSLVIDFYDIQFYSITRIHQAITTDPVPSPATLRSMLGRATTVSAIFIALIVIGLSLSTFFVINIFVKKRLKRRK